MSGPNMGSGVSAQRHVAEAGRSGGAEADADGGDADIVSVTHFFVSSHKNNLSFTA